MAVARTTSALAGLPLLGCLLVGAYFALTGAPWPWAPGQYPGTMNLLLFGCLAAPVALVLVVVLVVLAVSATVVSVAALRAPRTRLLGGLGLTINAASLLALLWLLGALPI